MRDVNNGWLIRYLHANTASAFFFLVYLHIGRGLYYGSYRAPRTLVWAIGTIILVLMRDLDQLTNLVVFQTMLFNFLVVLAVPILRKKMPEIERTYKVWFYPVSVIITALIFLGLVISTFFDDPVSAVTGFIVPAIGVVFYLYFDKKNKKEERTA